MKYDIGDVVKTIDGIDYNGNSLTCYPGEKYEISAYSQGKYQLMGFYRLVEESEIECLIMKSNEKCEKYEKQLMIYGKSVFIESGDEDNFKKVIIHHYCFGTNAFVYEWGKKDGEVVYVGIDRFWEDVLSAYKECYKQLKQKIKEIKKYINNI